MSQCVGPGFIYDPTYVSIWYFLGDPYSSPQSKIIFWLICLLELCGGYNWEISLLIPLQTGTIWRYLLHTVLPSKCLISRYCADGVVIFVGAWNFCPADKCFCPWFVRISLASGYFVSLFPWLRFLPFAHLSCLGKLFLVQYLNTMPEAPAEEMQLLPNALCDGSCRRLTQWGWRYYCLPSVLCFVPIYIA